MRTYTYTVTFEYTPVINATRSPESAKADPFIYQVKAVDLMQAVYVARQELLSALPAWTASYYRATGAYEQEEA